MKKFENFTPKTGFIAIVGRPNVGKSTLLNCLTGERIAAVSKKPQTTRTRITGILTKDETQYVFLDTPGMHNPHTALGSTMMREVSGAIGDVDAVLFVVEPEDKVHPIEREMLTKLKKSSIPVILLVNKCDENKKDKVLSAIAAYSSEFEFSSIIPISALTGDGTQIIFDEIAGFIKEGDWFFPSDIITDQPERKLASEMIREKIMRLLDKEIPHGTAVVIEEFNDVRGHLLTIRAEIFCEKASHKRIIIGKNGSMLKKIGTYARQDMEEFFGVKVNLDLWVKVRENWRDDEFSLNDFGFDIKGE